MGSSNPFINDGVLGFRLRRKVELELPGIGYRTGGSIGGITPVRHSGSNSENTFQVLC